MTWVGHSGFAHGNTFIEDGAQYKKFLKQHDYIPESEGAQEATIQKANLDKEQDRKLEAAVTEAVISHN